MDDSCSTALKAFAMAVAEALSKEEGRRAVEAMQKLGFLEDSAAGDGLGPFSKSGCVGIWEQKSRDGKICFERSARRIAEWSAWANVQRINPKGTKKRVVLVGESAARGFFYDPHFTPAQVLEKMLGCASVPEGIEVIDLAKNNLLFENIVDLLHSALVLEPDVFVIFSGNNVFPRMMQRKRLENHLFATILRERGMPGLKTHLEEKSVKLVEGVVRELQSLAIPVVFVIPESNLADWRLETSADAPWMFGSHNERWFRCLAQAREALRSLNIEAAEARAREMVELDHETAASGLTMLSECKYRLGSNGEARRFREKARDAHIWDTLPEPPRPLSVVQEALRHALSREGIPFVDLPRVFEESLGGDLPDRRLFLDYCHLTAQGIRIAMAATAEQVARLFGCTELPSRRLDGLAFSPRSDVEAEARFAAAIHNAHCGQPYEIVYHCCSKAVESSTRMAEMMVPYMDLATRRAPSWMCSAALRLIGIKTSSLNRYLRGAGEFKLLDQVLFDAIVDSLKKVGTEAREGLLNLRCREHGIAAGRRVNLLDAYYAPSWQDRDWAAWIQIRETRNHYYNVCSPISRFSFVCRSTDEVSLLLTCRLVDAESNGATCRLLVNETAIKSFSPTAKWRTFEFTVPCEVIRPGVNSLTIQWPFRTIPGEVGIERAARDFERGLVPRLVPVLAAIHSMTATIAPEHATASGDPPAKGKP